MRQSLYFEVSSRCICVFPHLISTTRYGAFIFLFCVSSALCAQPSSYSVANGHSHNDYEQPAPFWTAYQEGFGSIEADIFLHHDSLLVAHDTKELARHRSLEQYYLEPLAACVQKYKGFVFADGKKSLQLLVDIKTEAVATLNKLVETLRRYPALIKAKSLKIVISGNRPDPTDFAKYPSFIAFDGVLSETYTSASLEKIAMLSDNLASYVRGAVPTLEEWKQLEEAVNKAHELKRPVRFWGAPDNVETWKKMMELQVDYINTDHIEVLGRFLRGDSAAVIGK